jgi:diguanylate cyclase (GGDEF)-like protein
VGVRKFFQACAVAVKAGAVSFRDYLDHEIDPLTRDMLTRVFNRPQFERRRKALSTYSLVLLDIDNFKHINDCYGHSQGDVVLRAVAAVLRTSSGDRVFRVGGEEFAVLLANCTAEDAVKVAERLVATVRNLEILEGHPVTISAGVAWCGQPTDHEAVYRRADQALYRAKSTGKNRVARFEQPTRPVAPAPTPTGLAAIPVAAPTPAIPAAPLAALAASRN